MDPILLDLAVTWLAVFAVALLTVLGVVVLPWSRSELRASADALAALGALGALGVASVTRSPAFVPAVARSSTFGTMGMPRLR